VSKKILLVTLIIAALLLSACASDDNGFKVNQDLAKKEQLQLQLIETRAEVIKRFLNDRGAPETSELIGDAYNEYHYDETIATIYYYDNALRCFELSGQGEDQERLEEAKSYASQIKPTYTGEFSSEIVLWVKNLLGDEWEDIYYASLDEEENFKSMGLEDKKNVRKMLDERYEYYASKEGVALDEISIEFEDKYSDIILKEISQEYGISEKHIFEILADIEVSRSIGYDLEQAKSISEYDAILNYEGGSSLIASSESSLKKYIDALVDGKEETLQELKDSFQVSSVPKGIKVNIIEKKMTVAHVEILDGIFEGNNAWVLIESLKEKP
jgi:hypothetical protein